MSYVQLPTKAWSKRISKEKGKFKGLKAYCLKDNERETRAPKDERQAQGLHPGIREGKLGPGEVAAEQRRDDRAAGGVTERHPNN